MIKASNSAIGTQNRYFFRFFYFFFLFTSTFLAMTYSLPHSVYLICPFLFQVSLDNGMLNPVSELSMAIRENAEQLTEKIK